MAQGCLRVKCVDSDRYQTRDAGESVKTGPKPQDRADNKLWARGAGDSLQGVPTPRAFNN